MTAVKYARYDEARAHLKELLDAAADGRAAVVERPAGAAALVDRERFVRQLQAFAAPAVQLVPDEDGWLAVVADTPIAGEGETAADATEDLIEALRDYAEDWAERLRHAPNHRGNWALVQLVDLSTDDELRSWITGVTHR